MNKTINLYRSKDAVVNDSFDHVVFSVCLHRERNGYKSFFLCGCEPGVGTTTVAVELSIALALAGWKTLLLDCDFRKGNSYKRLNEGTGDGLVDYIKGTAELQAVVHKTNWPQLDYVPSGKVAGNSPLQILYSSRMASLQQDVAQDYDFVIVDGPSIGTSVDTDFLSLKADATILVAAMDGSQKKFLENARRQLEGTKVNLIGVIENKVELSEYKSYVKDYDYFNKKRFLKRR